jgi:hypothetical protein
MTTTEEESALEIQIASIRSSVASNTKSKNYSVRNGNLGGWPSIGENLEKMVHLMELPIKPEMLFIVQKATVCVLDRAVFL